MLTYLITNQEQIKVNKVKFYFFFNIISPSESPAGDLLFLFATSKRTGEDTKIAVILGVAPEIYQNLL